MIKEELLKEAKPVLFNTDMVQVILEGRKGVTRRLVKPQPEKDMIHRLGYCVDGDKKDIGKFGFGTKAYGGHILNVKPPYRPGDILYVRETWNFMPCIECQKENETCKKRPDNIRRQAKSFRRLLYIPCGPSMPGTLLLASFHTHAEKSSTYLPESEGCKGGASAGYASGRFSDGRGCTEAGSV